MREILFRGKRVDNGEWVYGFYANIPEHHINKLSGKNCIVSINNGLFMEVIPETVGQYTGLKDTNGKKIFEGDIVKYENNQAGAYKIGQKMTGFICFDEKTGSYVAKNNFQKHADFWFAIDIKVIGNIHDNPELLKEGK